MLHKKLHIPINLSLDEVTGYELNNEIISKIKNLEKYKLSSTCLLYTSPSPRDQRGSRMPSSA